MPGRKAISETDKAYMAGVIDSDGCIMLRVGKPSGKYKTRDFSSDVVVEMACDKVPKWLQATTGVGHISNRVRKGRTRTMTMWKCSGLDAEWVVKQIIGRLVQKQREAFLFLAFRRTVETSGKKKYAGLGPEVIKLRLQIVGALKEARYA